MPFLVGGVSMTASCFMDGFGVSQATAIARDNGVSGLVMKRFRQRTTSSKVGQACTGTVYTYDATNIRLAEMSIAYHIPR